MSAHARQLSSADLQTQAPAVRQAFAEEALRSIKELLIAVNVNGKILFCTRKAKEKLKIRSGSHLKNTLPEFWPNVQCTLKDGSARSDLHFKKLNRSFVGTIIPVTDQQTLLGALCLFEDNWKSTEISRQMLSVPELSREFNEIFNSCSEGLWICDAKANVIWINTASERLNNIHRDDVVGRNMKDLVREGFVDRSATLEVLKKKSKVDMIQQTRNGLKLMITAKPIFDEKGRLFRVVVTERDITEIEKLHQELKEQTAIRDQFRTHMLEMQMAKLESRRVIARSPCFVNTLKQAMKLSKVDSTVLIEGESGTGKGLIAELIHRYSNRASRPMIKINCGAIPESLVESELFGYEKGAFTGAHREGKPGYFELADGGILLLDEIVELPMSSQVKLLRFLEDGHISRVGATVSRKLDIRILATSNRSLESAVNQGEFRLDLYYRLNVIPIRVPPLRERRDCILPLVYHYIQHFCKKYNINRPLRFSPDATEALLAYPFPGNVRELMNLCERMVVMYEGDRVDLKDLPKEFFSYKKLRPLPFSLELENQPLHRILEAVEKHVLKNAMEKFGTQARASEALNVNQSTIARKLRKYGIS